MVQPQDEIKEVIKDEPKKEIKEVIEEKPKLENYRKVINKEIGSFEKVAKEIKISDT